MSSDIDSAFEGFIEALTEAAQPPITAPVDIGQRWPITRTGERTPINRGLRQLIYERDGHRCRFCGHPRHLQLDHIIPWSADGPDISSNFRTLCQQCNEQRSNYRTARDVLAIPVTLACDTCIGDWIRLHGVSRYGRRIPNGPTFTAYCGNCHELSTVTDPARLK